jgi:Dehydrogenases (flavoproteins)
VPSSNQQLDVDALIVGAGPGGSTAAYHLARHGLDVLMVEKAAFPREKVCGDGLTPRAVVQLRRLGIDIDDPRFERHQGLRIYSRRVTLELPWPDLEAFPNFGLMMTRAEFDELLARHAEKAGARLMERTEAVGPIQEDGWVTGATIKGEDGEERTVRARFVIAADGASSRFASQAGVRRDRRSRSGSRHDATTASSAAPGRGSRSGWTCARARTRSCRATDGCSRSPTARSTWGRDS